MGRYIAIIAIIALGVGFFAGLRVTKTAMVKTADTYVNDHGLFDYRLVSTVGYDEDDVAAFAELDGVRAAEGSFSADLLAQTMSGDIVLRAHSITGTVNTLSLVSGRQPAQANECIVDARYYTESDIGTKIVLSAENEEDTLSLFRYAEYEIVGIANSVYYLNYERGSTSLGSGSVRPLFIFRMMVLTWIIIRTYLCCLRRAAIFIVTTMRPLWMPWKIL